MSKHKEAYNEARSAFDGLKIEEQAIFLVESALSMLAQGIEQVGAMMARQFNDEGDTTEGTAATPPRTTKKAAGTKATKPATVRKPRPTRTKPDTTA
ncbi:MAG: hypothetical protein SH809_17885 [Rhodothermales bacterium]|nr:hypothetical protein [Rhodothermales bacterium]